MSLWTPKLLHSALLLYSPFTLAYKKIGTYDWLEYGLLTYEHTWPALRNVLSMSATAHFVYVSTII